MRAIGVSSIALATMVLTATDVRSANNNWCAIYTKPENENCTLHRAKLPRQLMEATASSQRLDRAPRELDRSLPTEQLQQDEHPLMIRVLRTSRDAQED